MSDNHQVASTTPKGTLSSSSTTSIQPSKAAAAAASAAAAPPRFVLRVAVGSQNPCKVDAVQQALQNAIGLSSSLEFDLDIQGFSVPSGVPDQPFGDVRRTQYNERGENVVRVSD
jgi:Protein of unknown function DUF84